MTYSALFQGHPVRFTGPDNGSVSCSLMLDDVTRILADAGVAPVMLATAPRKASGSGEVSFSTLLHWLEAIRTSGCREPEMFVHWLLRHMPTAQAALGLPLAGYLNSGVIPVPTRQVKRRAA
jgi:hypothetical protein